MVFVNKSGCWQLGLVSVLVMSEATISASRDYLLAQIVPDRTLGDESSAIAPNTEVKGLPAELIEGGAARGSNLFHSFAEFNVGELQRVYFANPAGIENILSRVTGSNVSHILGTLGVDGSANLFFLNPNGIIFGENAQLDITGSFFASTADSLIGNDGSEFSATNPQAPPLLTINLTPGLQYGLGATIINRGNLAVGQDLTLSASNLDLQGQLYAGQDLKLLALDTVRVRDSAENPFMAVADNQLLVQGNQGVDIFALNHPASGFFSGADIVLRSAIPVSGDANYWSGGNFRIEQLDENLGDLFSSYDPIIRSQGDVSFQNYQGASLHILAGGSVNISNVTINGTDSENSLQETVTLSDGTTQVAIDGSNQPTLNIRAGTTAVGSPLGITGSPIPTTLTFDSNNIPTANIEIDSIKVTQPNGLVFLTNQYQPNTATSGEIKVGEILTNDSFGGFSGNSGHVIIDSRGGIILPSFGTIDSSSGTGDGGDIRLLGNEFISLANGVSVNSVTFGAGKAGDIKIQAETLSINNGAFIDTSTFSKGSGGELTVFASEVQLTGTDPVNGPSRLLNQVKRGATGTGGNLTIETKNLTIRDGARVTTSTFGEGAGGNLTVAASESLELSGTSADTVFKSTLSSEVARGAIGTGGNLTVETKNLTIRDGANIATTTLGEGAGGNLTVNASESLELIGVAASGFAPSVVVSQTLGAGDAGDLTITTGKLIVRDGAFISSSTFGEHQAGNLTVNVSDSVKLMGTRLDPDGVVRSSGLFTETQGTGNAGDLRIETPRLIVQDGAEIVANTFAGGQAGDLTVIASESVELSGIKDEQISGVFASTFGAGDAGNLRIETGKLTVQDGAEVSVSTFAGGQAGDLTVIASESVELSGIKDEQISGMFAFTFGAGDAGNLRIETGKLTVQDGAEVSVNTFGGGQGGDLTVIASKAVELLRTPADAQFPTGLFAETQGTGNAGNLRIETPRLIVQDGAEISVSTFDEGQGGTLTVKALELVELVGADGEFATGLFSQVGESSTGKGGDLTINTEKFIARNGGVVSTSSFGEGKAGNITLKIEEALKITGADTGIFADTDQGSTGNGGSIFIDPETIILQDGASIAVNSQGSGKGGNIELQAGSLTLERGVITAETASNQGGNINLQLFDLLTLRNSSQISATAGTARTSQAKGDGGNIKIDAPFILSFPGENNNITAEAFLGTGGNINITTNRIFGREFLDISVSSQFGLEGTVSINTLELDPSQGLVELPSKLETPEISQGCEASRGGGSSFINTGRGGLPPSPTETLSSREVWKDVQLPSQLTKNSANSVKHSNTNTERIVEATAWIINEEGILELVAEESSNTRQGSCR